MIPYDEWVPLVMGQDAAPCNCKGQEGGGEVEAGPGLGGSIWGVMEMMVEQMLMLMRR